MNIFTKRTILGSVIILVMFFYHTYDIRSQDFAPVDQNQNYTISLEEYQRSHNRYVLARSNYLKFKTLASEEQAISATMEMLVNRDIVVVTYIDLLLERVKNAKGLDDAKVNEMLILLENEKDWFELHSRQITSAATLSELVEESNKASQKFTQINSLVYIVFSYLSYGRVYDHQTRLVDVFADLRSKFESIRGDQRTEYRFSSGKIMTIDNWLVESQSSINRSNEKLIETKARIDLFDAKTSQKSYNLVVSDLQNSRLHMLKATSFMEEIIREIKTAEN